RDRPSFPTRRSSDLPWHSLFANKGVGMKADLDRLMAERKLDGLLVMGDASGNPIMNYLTNGAPLERALLVKRRGAPLTLIHGSIDRKSTRLNSSHVK